jgi:hypothetical protein
MLFRLIILSVITSFIFNACDPAKSVFLINKTNKTAQFKWVIDSEGSGKDVDSAVFLLGTTTYTKRQRIIFGFGYWPVGEVNRFVDSNLLSIEIKGVQDSLFITDKAELKKFLISRRRGLLKETIRIKIR